MDGSAPLYLQAYGSYALDIDPGFSPRFLPWLDLGGVYAVAHVRGGGELGEDWHKAGQKLTKPNTWRDAIDCGRWLVANKWTSPGKLAVEGTSAGGIMVGRFLTEAPGDLAVAIVRVGDSNATRFQFMEAGPANIPEFGSIEDADGFKGLLEMERLPARQGRDAIPRRDADHRRHRSARRPLGGRQVHRPAAGRQRLRQAGDPARRDRRRPRPGLHRKQRDDESADTTSTSCGRRGSAVPGEQGVVGPFSAVALRPLRLDASRRSTSPVALRFTGEEKSALTLLLHASEAMRGRWRGVRSAT